MTKTYVTHSSAWDISFTVYILIFILMVYKLKMEIIKIGAEIDYLLSQTNKCKEPIYIEQLLCKLLI